MDSSEEVLSESDGQSRRSSILLCTSKVRDFLLSPKFPVKPEILSAFAEIIQHIQPFYYFHSVTMRVRQLLFLLTECGDNPLATKYVAVQFSLIYDLISDMKPATSKSEVLEGLIQTIEYDREGRSMDFSWRHQYAFEENVFNCDSFLGTFIDKFFATVHDEEKWKQFRAFEKEIVSYITSEYGVKDAPQLLGLAGRALSARWFLEHPLFQYHPTHPQFLERVETLRRLTGEQLGIKEKFLPPGAYQTPVKNCVGVYKRTIAECNLLPFIHLPEDLLRTTVRVHEFLYEELVQTCFTRSKEKMSLAEFRPTVVVGSEDIMPILVMALVLADIPNLPDIIDFFNDYSMQIEDNSKTGLYLMNMSSAYGAIMDPDSFTQ